MKKLVLLLAVIFAVGIITSSASVKVVKNTDNMVSVTADNNTSPEGDEKDAKKEVKKSEAKSAGCAGEKAVSSEKTGDAKAGCAGEKTSSETKGCCGGEKSASTEKAGCGGEKTAKVEKK